MRRSLIPAGLAATLALASAPGASAGGDGEAGPLDLARKVVEAFEALDADADGRLSTDELPVPGVFEKLDLDRNGSVGRDEARRALAAMTGTPLPPGPKGGAKGGEGKEPGKDGKGRARVGGEVKGGPEEGEDFATWAKRRMASDPRFDAESRVRQFLQNFDRDNDGRVQRKDYAGGDGDQVYRGYDRDRDGALDGRELLILMREQIEDLEKSRRHPTRGNFLLLYDLDDDRSVTREEYAFLRGPASAFRSYDDDGDGVVTYDEILYDRVGGRARGRGGDGPAPPENRSVWDIYDKDRDGRVTLEEFGGGEAVFRRLDRNRDGSLTTADG